MKHGKVRQANLMGHPLSRSCSVPGARALNIVDVPGRERSNGSQERVRFNRHEELRGVKPVEESQGEVIKQAREVPMVLQDHCHLTVICKMLKRKVG